MDSIIMQKQVRDNATDLQEFCKELQEWGNEMKQKDESLKRSSNNQAEVPLPRNKISKVTEKTKEATGNKADIKKGKKPKGCDYAAWDKFDADAYCTKLDKENTEENSSPESELSDEIDESAVDQANLEKEKGNAFVKKQQWDHAIECYTRAIECYAYDPIYYANRALCYLKKEKFRNAESDCTTALQLDKTYVKAYQRRAAARENLNQLSEAHSDLLRVLELEKKNKESRNALIRIEKKLEVVKKEKTETVEEPRPISKFTLSRQKQKNPSVDMQAKCEGVKKEVPAIGEHVIEHVVPSTSGINIKKQLDIGGDSKHTLSKLKSKDEDKPSKLPEDTLENRFKEDDIELFQSIFKPPKTRSKKPLKRIQIIDVDLETEKIYSSNKLDTKTVGKEGKQSENIHNENEKNKNNIILLSTISETIPDKRNNNEQDSKHNCDSFENLHLPIPKTAVQFYNSWKSVDNKEWRKKYLQKINSNDLKEIFKESLESKVFSEIVEILNENFNVDGISSYDYLTGLSQVKRFSTLIMFMSTKDKKNLLDIVDHLKQENRYTLTDIDNLIKLYEL